MKPSISNLFACATVISDKVDPSDEIMQALQSPPSSPLVSQTTSLTGKYLSQGRVPIDNMFDLSSTKHIHITCI
jgi:hypothetical protein